MGGFFPAAMSPPRPIEARLWEGATSLTHIHAFLYWEQAQPKAIFLRQPYGRRWHTVTWQEAGDQTRRIATALQALGVQKGSLVGLLSRNCYHWILADLAIAMTGAVSVPFYPNLAPADLQTVLEKVRLPTFLWGSWIQGIGKKFGMLSLLICV